MAMWSLKTRPKPGSTSFAARALSGVGVTAGWISNFKLISLFPLFGPGVYRLFPGLAGPIGLDLTTTGLAAGFHRRHVLEDMLLWSAEVQYVCRNAARQSYGQQI